MTALLVLWAALAPGSQDEVAHLLELLRSDKVDVRQEAAQKLVALGEGAEPALRRAAASGDSELNLRVKEVLQKIVTNRLEKAWDERARRLPESCRDATYTMRDEGREAGTLRIHTSSEKGHLVFEDQFDLDWRGTRVTLKLRQESSPDHELRLRRLVAASGEEMLTYTAETREGKLLIDKGGRRTEVDLPRNLISPGSLFRAVPILPKVKGFSFKFFLLDETGRVSDESTFSCLGEEEVSHEGKTVKAWKWAFEREQVIKGQDESDYYWVTDDRILRIKRARGREFVLSSPLK